MNLRKGELDARDRLLLRRLAEAGCNLRTLELVNENRDHDMTAAEVQERLERLQQLGYVQPAYWSVTPEGTAQTPARFRASDPAGKPQTVRAA